MGTGRVSPRGEAYTWQDHGVEVIQVTNFKKFYFCFLFVLFFSLFRINIFTVLSVIGSPELLRGLKYIIII